MQRFTKYNLLALIIPIFLLSASPVLAWGEEAIFAVVTGFLGLFVGLAGFFLDYTLTHFVVMFGENFLSTGVGVAVEILWEHMRDIFNITFIFALVYLGFRMILDSDNSTTRRWLITLIMAALLINFSLFFTKAIIDFTNLTATQILKAFVIEDEDGPKIEVAHHFMDTLGVPSLYKGDASGGEKIPELTWGYVFGTAIILLVMMFVFAAGALMLAIRYVVLMFYMIFSPAMFIGWIFPQLQSYARQYWQGFLGRSFFAPIYALLVYLSYTVLINFFGAGGRYEGKPPNFADVLSGKSDPITMSFDSTIPAFVVCAIFLLASVIVANKLSVDGGAGAMQVIDNTRRNIKNRVDRVAARGGRAVTGAMAAPYTLAKYGGKQAVRRSSYGLGRGLEKKLAKLETQENSISGMALRTFPSINRSMQSMAKNMTENKAGLSTTVDQDRQEKRTVEERVDRRRKSEAGVDNAERANSFTQRQQNRQQLGAQMANMSTAELANFAKNNMGSEDFVASLTDAQLSDLKNTNRFSKNELDGLHKLRNEAQLNPALAVLAAENKVALPDPGQSATPAQRAAYDARQTEIAEQQKQKTAATAYLRDKTPQLSTLQLKALNESGVLLNPDVVANVTDSQIKDLNNQGVDTANIKTARDATLFKEVEDKFDNASTSADDLGDAFDKLGRIVTSLSGERLAGLGISRLTDERIAMNLSDKQIESLQESQKYTTDQIKAIKDSRTRGQMAIATGDYTTKMPSSGKSMVNSQNTNLVLSDGSKTAEYTNLADKKRKAFFSRSPEDAAKLPLSFFTNPNSFKEDVTPLVLETRFKKIGSEGAEDIRRALEVHLGVGLGQRPSEITQLKNNPWTKWEKSNSIYAAQFFSD